MTEFEKTLTALPSPIDTEDKSENYDNTPPETHFNEETKETGEPDDTAAKDESVSDIKPRKAKSILKKSVIFILAGVSVLVFGVTAAVMISSLSIDETLITRAMLGEFFGGMENIREIAAYEVEYSPITDLPDSIDSESRLETLGPINTPTEQRSYENATLELTNETPYEPDMNEILAMERAIPTLDELHTAYGTDAPIVLILHTHATEAFADSAVSDYRSTDITKNVVSLGTIIADKLNENGISAIHSTTLFDAEDFTMAYYNASLEIRETLEAYPSISYIIDIHRDSIESDGVYIAPTTETSEGSAAQMMFVIGTDYGGSGHSTWRNNLSLAARLQTSLNESTPRLMRSINLRSASFNEQYSDGSLLLEIGACASTLEEAQRSAEKFADALIREILGE